MKKLVTEMALELLVTGKPVTPKEIDDHIGSGPYASKMICDLRKKYGHEIIAVKEGRNVKHYLYVGPGTSKPRVPKEKKVKAKADKPFTDVPVIASPTVTEATEKPFTVDPNFDNIDISDIEREYSNLRG